MPDPLVLHVALVDDRDSVRDAEAAWRTAAVADGAAVKTLWDDDAGVLAILEYRDPMQFSTDPEVLAAFPGGAQDVSDSLAPLGDEVADVGDIVPNVLVRRAGSR